MNPPKKCQATKKNGDPCPNYAIRGQDTCRSHLQGPVPLLPRPKCRCPYLPYPHAAGAKCVDGALMPVPEPTKTVALIQGTPRRPAQPLDADHRRVILELVAQGCRPLQAAKAAGITAKTMYRRMKDDDAWREAITEAQAEATELAEHALWKLAIGETTGQPQFEALRFWLMNRAAQDWKDPRSIKLDVNGSVDHVVIDRATVEAEIRQIEATLRSRVQGQLDAGIEDAEIVE